jgi:hypothetical protein
MDTRKNTENQQQNGRHEHPLRQEINEGEKVQHHSAQKEAHKVRELDEAL